MALVLLIGGARSGKSQLATALAREQRAAVTVIATAEAGDHEMAARIEAHRRERPGSWRTIEEPLELTKAIQEVPAADCLILDCLTLWVSNLLERDVDVETVGQRAAAAAALRSGLTIAVTNEVGLGIIPDNPHARTYRDLLGRVNASWAAAADRSYLLVAGRLLALQPASELLEGLV
jgi:adenosyl cobinamide kinase/adenosyl cobinamide phosphate guanylyltransferase